MAKDNTDLSKILKGYSDEWVALSSDSSRVVGSGKTFQKALDTAKKSGEEEPIITRVPENYGNYVLWNG